MNRQHSKRKPDFFAILVLLVMVCFGLTVMLQLIASGVGDAVEGQSVNQPIKTLQARS
jgi:uncharacterized membrane protein